MAYAGGDGTSGDPFQLTTVQDINDYMDNGGEGVTNTPNNYAIMLNDIDARNGFITEIPASASTDFYGKLDLDGHTLIVFNDYAPYWYDILNGSFQNGLIKIDRFNNTTPRSAVFDSLGSISLLQNLSIISFSSTIPEQVAGSVGTRLSDAWTVGAHVEDVILMIDSTYSPTGQTLFVSVAQSAVPDETDIINFTALILGTDLKVEKLAQEQAGLTTFFHGSPSSTIFNPSNFPYHISTGNWDVTGNSIPAFKPAGADIYEVSGTVTIDASPAERQVWLLTSAMNAYGVTNSSDVDGSYQFLLANGGYPAYVLFVDDIGTKAEIDTNYVIGNRIHPPVPNGYYYICTVDGYSGSPLPLDPWDGTQSITVGTAEFQPFKHNQPDMHGMVYPDLQI